MDAQLYLGIFTNEDDVLNATRASKEAGYPIYDVYSPYAVHGLESAMGLKPSRLTYVCLAFALAGLLLGVFAQFWIGAIDWPLNVGGKPFNSLPAYLPVIFELTVLFGGLGVVFSMLFRTKLFPGKKEWLPDARVTNDHFVIALVHADASFDTRAVHQLWQKYNLLEAKSLPEVFQ